MIDEARTLELYGYISSELKLKSHKPIIVICDNCNKIRVSPKAAYRDLCKTCCQKGKTVSKETRDKISEAKKGVKRPNMTGNQHPLFGKSRSEDTKEKISKTRIELGCGIGLIHTNKTKLKMSKAKKGVKRPNITGNKNGRWEGGVSFGLYCDKFNDECRNRNREKYDNQCFICGKTKEENSNRALSVHHVIKNKMEGCDGSKWRLIPLCMSCHSKSHTEPMLSRLKYLLGGV